MTTERVPLESCVCGQCFDCPDGWHEGDELPCGCTADCALGLDPAAQFSPDDLHDLGLLP